MNLRLLLAISILMSSITPALCDEPVPGTGEPSSGVTGTTQQQSSTTTAPSTTAPNVPAGDGVDRSQLKLAPAGSKLFVAPVLMPGKPASVTVVDKNNQALANVSITVNGTAVETNPEGRARFVVPRTAATLINLPMEDASKDLKVVYAITSGGALVLDAALSKFIDSLFATAPKKDLAPRILYSPSVVQPGHTVSVIGINFDGQPGLDKVLIDNVECEVLASSPVSILALLPAKLSTGAAREMFATSHGESTSAVEVDSVAINSNFDTLDGAADGLFKVEATGTKMPVLLHYENQAPAAVSIATSEGAQLPASGWAMTQGGTDGDLALRVNLSSAIKTPVSVEIAPDLAIIPDAAEDDGVRMLAKNLIENRIWRIKRQMIAFELQTGAVQKARAELSATTPVQDEEVERLTAELNTLSLRQQRFAAALLALRAMYLAVGATEEQYRSALDEAAGGAYQAVAEPKAAAGELFAANAALAEARRQRRLAEPRMKLLPPEEWNGTQFVELAITTKSPPTSTATPAVDGAHPPGSTAPATDKPAGADSTKPAGAGVDSTKSVGTDNTKPAGAVTTSGAAPAAQPPKATTPKATTPPAKSAQPAVPAKATAPPAKGAQPASAKTKPPAKGTDAPPKKGLKKTGARATSRTTRREQPAGRRRTRAAAPTRSSRKSAGRAPHRTVKKSAQQSTKGRKRSR